MRECIYMLVCQWTPRTWLTMAFPIPWYKSRTQLLLPVTKGDSWLTQHSTQPSALHAARASNEREETHEDQRTFSSFIKNGHSPRTDTRMARLRREGTAKEARVRAHLYIIIVLIWCEQWAWQSQVYHSTGETGGWQGPCPPPHPTTHTIQFLHCLLLER